MHIPLYKAAMIFVCISCLTVPIFTGFASLYPERFELTYAEQEYLRSISDEPLVFAYSYDVMMDSASPESASGMLKPFIDILQNELGLKTKFEKLKYVDALERLHSGDVDFYGLFTINNEVRQEYVTIDPIYKSNVQIVSRVDEPIGSIMQLKNKQLGVLEGRKVTRTIETYLSPNGAVIYYPDIEPMLDDLENGRLHALATADSAELEILEHKGIKYEFNIDNLEMNQGFISTKEELRPLADIINRYIANDRSLEDNTIDAKRDYVINVERQRLSDEIAFIRSKYDSVEIVSGRITYPLSYLENGEFKGLQIEINDIFEQLTSIPVVIANTEKYSNGIEDALIAVKDGGCFAVGGGYYSLSLLEDPAYEFSHSVWTDKIRAYSYREIDSNIRMRDLRVGITQFDRDYMDWQTMSGTEPILFQTRTGLMDALKDGKIDVALTSEMTFNYASIVKGDHTMREYGGISADAQINMTYSVKNPEFNKLYNAAIEIYHALYPSQNQDWKVMSDRYKADYMRIRDEQEKLIVLIIVIFGFMMLVLAYLLRKYTLYDHQISQLIQTQQTFDLAWGNIKTRQFISKGNHTFFRKWGLEFSGPKCSMDELTEAFGWDLYHDYVKDMDSMGKDKVNFIVAEKKVISPLDGGERYYRRYLHRLSDCEFMSCLQDITPEMTREQELTQLATTDFLSNLLTRRAMNDIIIEKCAELREKGGFAVLMIFDIDDFKQVNDTYGHDVGDKVLIAVSDIIQAADGFGNTTSRWGGEEFLAMLECDSIRTAEERARNILKTIAGTKIKFAENKYVRVTVSAGLSRLDPYAEYTDSIRLADEALYKAKRSLKNCVRTI